MRRRQIITRVIAALTTAAMSAGSLPASAAVSAKKKAATLRVLVTNDDGVTAPGIDAVVEALRVLKDVKVIVVAPLTNQSGTSDTTSPTPPAASDARTASGYAAKAVAGFPGDSVNYALDTLKLKVDLVVSGINQIQNVGPAVAASGTVGAGKIAVRHSVPALAVSQGVGTPFDFPAGAREAVRWVKEHRKALLKRARPKPTTLDNLNVPSCPTGSVRGVIKNLPVSTETGQQFAAANCASTLTNPKDDVEGLNNGFATISKVPAA